MLPPPPLKPGAVILRRGVLFAALQQDFTVLRRQYSRMAPCGMGKDVEASARRVK